MVEKKIERRRATFFKDLISPTISHMPLRYFYSCSSDGNWASVFCSSAPGAGWGSSDGMVSVTSVLVSSKTVDDLRVDNMVRKIAVIMIRIAATVVILVKKPAAPGLPKMVWLAPPKAAPIEAPFPA